MTEVAAPAIGGRNHGEGSRGPRCRPMPADFPEHAASGPSVMDLMRHYRVGNSVVHRWINEVGGKPRAHRVLPPKPAPVDFAHFAAIETVDLLMKRYSCGTALITRWRREVSGDGPKIRPSRETKPMPDGFALVAANLTERELRERYGISKHTVHKWCARAAVSPRKATRPVVSLGAMGRPKAAPMGQNRDTSRAGMAADFLRKFGPVVRCDATGRFNPTGDHWRRGPSVLCADEIIARALRNGWQPDAWKALAA